MLPRMNEFEKDLLAWCRDQRSTMLDDLKPLEGHTWAMSTNDGGAGWRDITGEWIETLKKRIADLDRIIEAYERRCLKALKAKRDQPT